MKNMKRVRVLIAVLVGIMIFAGCTVNPVAEKGTLIIRVNPEISVDYDSGGLVTNVTGLNNDGKAITDSYDDYIGKPSAMVVKELVGRIKENGYFLSDVDREARNITLEIEPNSYVPKKDFLDNIVEGLSEVTDEIESPPTITAVDEKLNTITTKSGKLSKQEALNIAYAHAAVKENDTKIIEAKRDRDNGRLVWDLDFVAGDTKYEYEIDADTGEIVKFSSKAYGASGNTAGGTQTTANSQYLTADKVKSIAFKDAGVSEADVNLHKLELDRDNGRVKYELDFYVDGVEYEYDIDAYTGEIIKKEIDREGQSSTNVPGGTGGTSTGGTQPTNNGYITAAAAKKIALDHAGVSEANVRIEKVELDYDDGRAVYEVDFDTNEAEYDYDIDAKTGSIIKHEKDNNNKDGDTDNHSSEKSGQKPSGSEKISAEQALSIALKHAGVSRSQIYDLDIEYDSDNVYEIDFEIGNLDYEYEIDAASGAIIKYEIDD